MLAAIVVNVVSLGHHGRHHGRHHEIVSTRSSSDGCGMWVGFKLYGKLDEAAFRKVILWLLLASGLGLIASQGILTHACRRAAATIVRKSGLSAVGVATCLPGKCPLPFSAQVTSGHSPAGRR